MRKYLYKMDEELITEMFFKVFEGEYREVINYRLNKTTYGGLSICSIHFKGDIGKGDEEEWVDEVFELTDTHIKPVEFYYYNLDHNKKWRRLMYELHGVEYLEDVVDNMG